MEIVTFFNGDRMKSENKISKIIMFEIVLSIISIVFIKTGFSDDVKNKAITIVLDRTVTEYKAVFLVYDAQKAETVKVTKYSALRKYVFQTYKVPIIEFKLSKKLSKCWCNDLIEGARLRDKLLNKLQECKCSLQQNQTKSIKEKQYDFVFVNENLGVRIYVQLPPCED